ncbi:MAG: hypothetical protein US19_C0004G0018 [Candidatus Daviesbacteria bacterium GW2011_GWB1_36_5]|uniref:Uncharacterized protein n=1 Tax=Candidatus Daviesbacteria bacterium GW2011_GWB1_36_5 TaxID=1618426 RepID=A0A0G0FA92_9BACT|nr:MAG: hypothetical protein US19_C0004G0018 [Candidatus Daviesbacteria bacterium GW2011_GWB1_36_5]
MARIIKQKEKNQEKRFHTELLEQLVAALAWNETIQGFVKEFIEPRIPGSGLLSKLIYALLVTLLAVLITYQLSRLSARFQQSKH